MCKVLSIITGLDVAACCSCIGSAATGAEAPVEIPERRSAHLLVGLDK